MDCDDLPKGLQNELENIARYSDDLMSYELNALLFKYVPVFGYNVTKGADDEQRERIRIERKTYRAKTMAFYEKTSRMLGWYPNKRCPTCGNKVSTRRCLACDVESGVAKFTETEVCQVD